VDVLTNVLETNQVRGVILSAYRHVAPWGLRIATPDVLGFHLVTEGECWLRTKGEPIRLLQGDLVVLPSGADHVVSDGPASPAISIEAFLERERRGERRAPAKDARHTTMVCGAFRCEGGPSPLFSLLPPVLHVTAPEIRASAPLDAALRLLLTEIDRRRPGSEALIDRLVDALFIYVLRAWVEQQPENARGWLGALHDPAIGHVISLVHKEPARRWTVDAFAAAAKMSRAAFARRFTQLVGMPPLTYLTRWRLELARRALRDSNRTLAAIASDVGYESEFAFSRAFKRQLGAAPSAFRGGRGGARSPLAVEPGRAVTSARGSGGGAPPTPPSSPRDRTACGRAARGGTRPAAAPSLPRGAKPHGPPRDRAVVG